MSSKKKIYTRSGDKGKTSLYGGKRLFKNHLRLNAYGSIDELNSVLGVILSKLNDKRVEEFVNQIQKDLFRIGSYLAGAGITISSLVVRVDEMEEVIDSLQKQLPQVSHFILPEGTESASYLYLSRAIARRAEREIVSLSLAEKVDEKVLMYFNRLSDFLYITARYLNFKAGIKESIWQESTVVKK